MTNPYQHTLRKRLGKDEFDESVDERIAALTPMEQLREIVAWELGDASWASSIIEMAVTLGVVERKK